MHHTRATPPVPLPRTQRCTKTKSLDEELLRTNCSPECPAEPTEMSPYQNQPPPVLPKKKIIKQNSENIQTLPIYEEVLKDMNRRISRMVCQESPAVPPTPPKKDPDGKKNNSVITFNQNDKCQEVQKKESLSSRNISWKEFCNDLKRKGATEKEIIVALAEYLYEEIQKYNDMMSEHGNSLKEAIDELHSIAANINKVSKGTKIAGITGGATTALGGVAAAAGVILSPFTLGSSLALTAIGVGVAAAGGVTGASAAIANKANLSSDKKKIQVTLQDFEERYEKILPCLKFINEGMDQLKLYGQSTLSEVKTDSENASKVLRMYTSYTNVMAAGRCTKVSGTIRGFALGMEFYFNQEKDGQKLKKDLRSKFAKKIDKLADDLGEGFNELTEIQKLFA
ncbi:apolipoprotein L3-like isoform X2 [Oryzias latipes]|uniref:apolipoprotein L3-like isoform X2 n=1 Tax=Oryzias latipes TaxID=8090 RepID=UPI000CE2183A|nr:apolipoprotein L3-like isoform X2 [Oryzias latipes]